MRLVKNGSVGRRFCRGSGIGKILRLGVAAGVLVWACAASAAARKDADLLLETYSGNAARLESNIFGLPMFLESCERNDQVTVDVYGVFDYPFGSVASMLSVPGNWCDVVSLPPNVKACTYTELQGAPLLTFYLGRKTYQPPEEAPHKVVFRYRKVDHQPNYLHILLTADEGPLGTTDHAMTFEAVPVDAGKTFVHVSYAYRDSRTLRFASNLYFATLGRDKSGFTVTGKTSKGEPVFIGGPRGALERNAVRYYLAIQSYMSSLRQPESSRFGTRIAGWYDLSIRFKKQLYDLERDEYLRIKKKEHENQAALQKRLRTRQAPEPSR